MPASSRIACGSVLMPTPSSRMESACSYNSQSMPRARSIKAVVSPPIPPPTMIAFMARTPYRTPTRGTGSHGPSLRGKRLRRLRLQLSPGLRPSLNFKIFEILPVACAVTEDLVFTGQILLGAEHPFRAVPGRSLQRERGIDQMWSTERNQIGTTGGQNRIDLIGAGNIPHAHGCKASFVADLVGEWRLEHATKDGLRLAHSLTGRDVDQVDARFGERPRDKNGVIAGDAALRPVGRGDTYRHRLMCWPDGPQRVEHLPWKTQTVFERTAVGVSPLVG